MAITFKGVTQAGVLAKLPVGPLPSTVEKKAYASFYGVAKNVSFFVPNSQFLPLTVRATGNWN